MKKETRSKIWDVGLLFAGMILPAILALLLGFMEAELSIPVWMILSYSLVVAFLFYFVWRHVDLDAQKQREEHTEALVTVRADAYDQIRTLQSELQEQCETSDRLLRKVEEMGRVVFDGGLYYHQRDHERAQPFCRICRDEDELLITAQILDNQMYFCPRCNDSHRVEIGTSKIIEDEDILF